MQRLRGERAMTREQALRKVLACLRRSKSTNPNEAAIALRQARSLMEQYGLTEDDAVAAEIRNFDSPTRSRGATPMQSVLGLARLVANGYRCEMAIVCTRLESTSIRFYGTFADAQVAAYAFTVLRRQMEAARLKHTARIRKRANKERRGEEFAYGWVLAVSALFPKAELTDEQDRARKRAIAIDLPGADETSGREVTRGRAGAGDRLAGFIAGKNARLHSGLAENGQRRLEQRA